MAGKPGTGIGNKRAEKYKTSEERAALFDKFCEHVRKGYSDESFPECDMRTFWYYANTYASELQAENIERAIRERQLFWEKLGTAGTGGKIPKFNAVSWKFNMQNRFDWRDKRDDNVKVNRDGAAELAASLLDDDGPQED